MTIEQISDAAKRLKKKYDETDPERLAEQMKILVSREPMGLFEGCCKGFFLVHRRKKHITINGDLPDVLQKVVLAMSWDTASCIPVLPARPSMRSFSLIRQTKRNTKPTSLPQNCFSRMKLYWRC